MSSVPDDLRRRTEEWIAADPQKKTRRELTKLLEAGDADELTERMDGSLEFGTAGLRGKVEAGSNRMNRAVVIRTSRGRRCERFGQAKVEHLDLPPGRDLYIARLQVAMDHSLAVRGRGGLGDRPVNGVTNELGAGELDQRHHDHHRDRRHHEAQVRSDVLHQPQEDARKFEAKVAKRSQAAHSRRRRMEEKTERRRGEARGQMKHRQPRDTPGSTRVPGRPKCKSSRHVGSTHGDEKDPMAR